MRSLITFCALAASVTAAQACPDYSIESTFGELALDAGFLPDPLIRVVEAGGDVDLGACSDVPSLGWVTDGPDLEFTYEGSSGGALTITAISLTGTDLILLVNDPTGDWHTDDDGGFAHSPAVSIGNAPDGVYDVWVGTYTEGKDGAPVLLMFTERD